MDLLEALEYIRPDDLDYQEWVNVGMALKQEGYSVKDWDDWSRADSRYHNGECEKKWQSFNGSASPVTAGTIIQMAKDRGMTFRESKELGWDDEIAFEQGNIGVTACEGVKFHEPANWNPVNEIVTYLETLFDSSENVGYVTETYKKIATGKSNIHQHKAIVIVQQVSLLPPSTIVTVIFQMYSAITNPRQERG